MTVALRNLKAGLAVLVVSALALGTAGLFSVDQAEAQSPPTPPARFTGIVTIDGETAPSGTAVVALIDGESCGVGSVDAGGRYVLDVDAFIPGNNNCGVDGSVVSFQVGDAIANETGAWINYQLNELDLTVTAQEETPTATEPPATETETPGTETETPGTETETPDTETPTQVPPTPRPPVTGSGLESGSSSSAGWLVAIIGLAALALGTTGVAAARRRA